MRVEKVDFAIITIRQEEDEALLARFTTDPYSHPTSQQTYGISEVQTKGGKNCTVAIARTIRQGNDASQQLANRMINNLDSKMLLVLDINSVVPHIDFKQPDVIYSSY